MVLKTGTHIHFGESEFKLKSKLVKKNLLVFIKILKEYIFFDPAIPPLEIHPSVKFTQMTIICSMSLLQDSTHSNNLEMTK